MLKTCLIGIATATIALSASPAEARDRDREYDRSGRYYEPRRVSSNEVWQGRDGRYYCRRGNGTTGLVIGAAGGALLGRAVDGGRNRTTGTVLGAAAGALLGREVQRNMRCR
jgi:outer membrane lipoprotein SlyB